MIGSAAEPVKGLEIAGHANRKPSQAAARPLANRKRNSWMRVSQS